MRIFLLAALFIPTFLLGNGVQFDVAVEDTFGKGMGYKANYVSGLFGVSTLLTEHLYSPFLQAKAIYFPSTDWHGASFVTGFAFGNPCDPILSKIYGTVDYLRRVDDFYQLGFGMIFPTPIGGIYAEYCHPVSSQKVYDEEYFNDYIGDYTARGKALFIPCQIFRFGIENRIDVLPWMQGIGRFEGYYFRNAFRPSIWGGAITLRANIGSNASVFVKGGYDKVFGKTLIGGLQIDLYRTFACSKEPYCFPFPWVERDPIPVLDDRCHWETNY